MEEILKMSIADKIILLNQIKKDYQSIKRVWTSNKVLLLETQILIEIENLGNFVEPK